jgi:hypothetical protein
MPADREVTDLAARLPPEVVGSLLGLFHSDVRPLSSDGCIPAKTVRPCLDVGACESVDGAR